MPQFIIITITIMTHACVIWPINGQGMPGVTDLASLRRELGRSLSNMERSNDIVRKNIASVSQMCPVTSIRAQRIMKKWGMQRFESFFAKLQNIQLAQAFKHWKIWLEQRELLEKHDKMQRFVSMRKLDVMLARYQAGAIAAGFVTWHSNVRQLRLAEYRARQDECARKIQNQVRMWIARRRVERMREQRQQYLEYNSAVSIQNMFRACSLRSKGRYLINRIKRGQAAVVIQQLFRRKLARRKVGHRSPQHAVSASVCQTSCSTCNRQPDYPCRDNIPCTHDSCCIHRSLRGGETRIDCRTHSLRNRLTMMNGCMCTCIRHSPAGATARRGFAAGGRDQPATDRTRENRQAAQVLATTSRGDGVCSATVPKVRGQLLARAPTPTHHCAPGPWPLGRHATQLSASPQWASHCTL